jgi:hypothetical protein
LSTAKLGVRWPNGPGNSENATIALQHDKGGVLISKPAESSERHHAVSTDDNQSSKIMSDARKSGVTAFIADPVLKNQVTAINADLDAVAKQDHNAVSWHD